MAKGKTIYLTQKEIVALLLTLEDWENSIEEPIYAHRLKNGLGTAWGKLEETKKEVNS